MRKRFPLPPRAEEDGASAVIAVVAGVGGAVAGAANGGQHDAPRRQWLSVSAPLLAVLADAARLLHVGPRLLADLHVALDPLESGDGESLHKAPLFGAFMRLVSNLGRVAVALGSARVAPTAALALQARAAVEGQQQQGPPSWIAVGGVHGGRRSGTADAGPFDEEEDDEQQQRQQQQRQEEAEEQGASIEDALLQPHEDPALREAVAATSASLSSSSSSSSYFLQQATELVAAAMADPSGRVLQPRLRVVAPRVAQMLELVVGPAVGTVATASAVAAKGALDVLQPAGGGRPHARSFGLLQQQQQHDGERGAAAAAAQDAVADALATRLSRETSLAESWASGGGGGFGGASALRRSSSNNSLIFSSRRRGVARPSSGSRPSTARSDLTGAGAAGRGDSDDDDDDEDNEDWRRRLSTVRRPSHGAALVRQQQQQPLPAVAGGDGDGDDDDDEENDAGGGDSDEDDNHRSAAAAPSPTAAATQFALDLEEHRRWALFALLACPDALASSAARRLLALLLRESLLLPLRGAGGRGGGGGWCVPLHPLFEQAVGPTLARVCAEAARDAALKAAAAGQQQEEEDEDDEGEDGGEDEGGRGEEDAGEEAGEYEHGEPAPGIGGRRGGNLRQRGAELWRRHRLGSAKKGAAAGAPSAGAAATKAAAAAVVVAPEDSPSLVREAWAAAAQTAWRERAGRRRLAAAKLAEACDWLSMLPQPDSAPSSSGPRPSPFAKALAARQDALLAAISYGAAECRWYFLHAGEEMRVPVVTVVQQQQQLAATTAAATTTPLPGGRARVRGALKAAAAAALASAAATAAAAAGGGSSSSFHLAAATPVPADPEALDLVHQLTRAHALLARRREGVAECAALCARRAARDRAPLGQAAGALRAAAASPGAHPLLKEAAALVDAIRREALERADALLLLSSSSPSSSFEALARRLELRAGWLRLLASLSLKRTSTGGAPGGGPCALQVAVAARDPRLFCAASDLLERRLPALEGFVLEAEGERAAAGTAASSTRGHQPPLPPTAGAVFDARCDLHAALAPPAHLDKLTALARAAVDAAAAAGGGSKPVSVAAAVRLLAAAPAALGALHWVARPNVPQPEAYDCSASCGAGAGGGALTRQHEAAADRAAGVILLQTLAPALKAAACQAQRVGEVGPVVEEAIGTTASAPRWAAGAAAGDEASTLAPPERACSPRGGHASSAAAASSLLQPAGIPPPPQTPAPPMEPLARALHLAVGLAALGPAVAISPALAVRPSDHVRRAMRACLSALLSGAGAGAAGAGAGVASAPSSSSLLPLPSELELRVRDLLYVCARVQSVLPDADVVGPDLLELLLLEGGQPPAGEAEALAARASSVDKGGQAGRGAGGSGAVSTADIPATVLAAADGSEGAILHFAPSARAAALAAARSLAAGAAAAAAANAVAAANAAPGRPTLVAKYADLIVGQQQHDNRYASLPELTALVRLFGPCAAVAVARRLELPIAEAVAQLDDSLGALTSDHGGQQALKALQVAVVRFAVAAADDDDEAATPSPPRSLLLLPPEPLAAVASRLGGGRARSVTAAAGNLGRALRLRELAGAALERAMHEEAPLVVAVTRALGTPSATGEDGGGAGGGSRHVCDVFGLPRPQQKHKTAAATTAPDPFLAALLVGTAASGARLRRWCGWPVVLGVALASGGGSGVAEVEDRDVTAAAASLAVATHVAVDRGLDLGARLLKPYGTADVAADAAALFAAAAAGGGATAADSSSSSAAPPSVALALARHLHWGRRGNAGSLGSSKGAAPAKGGAGRGTMEATRVWSAAVLSGGSGNGNGGAAGDGACWIDAKG
jgi:hypothetical protein